MSISITDFTAASDAQFRDVYGRHQFQATTATVNVLRKTYHHVSGATANVSAAEVVSLDPSNNNAQYDLLLRDASLPLALANLTAANAASWSATSLLSVRHGTTAIRSGNVGVNNLSLAANAVAKLDNCIVRSFQRTLGGTSGNTTEICAVSCTNGAYTAELNVVQSASSAVSIARRFVFSVYWNATANAWRRLVALTQNRVSGAYSWLVEIRVSDGTTTLRLVRTSGSTTTGIECSLTVHQSRADPVTITPSTATETGVSASGIIYATTTVCQENGLTAICTDQTVDGYALTVGGDALFYGGANVGGLVLRGSATGSGVTSTVSSGSTALITSGGVFSFINTSTFVTGNATISGRTTGKAFRITGSSNYVKDGAPLDQGAWISWDTVPGTRGFDMINKYGFGSGGFFFYNSAGNATTTAITSGSATLLASLRTSGFTLAQGVVSAPGHIIGSVIATGKDATINEGVTVSPTSISRTANGSGWITIATFTYTPKSSASRVSMHFDDDYLLSGFGGDTVESRITVDTVEAAYKQQKYVNAAGGGTRSNVIFPISGIFKNESTATKTIRIQVRLASTDDTLTVAAAQWVFKLWERKT